MMIATGCNCDDDEEEEKRVGEGGAGRREVKGEKSEVGVNIFFT